MPTLTLVQAEGLVVRDADALPHQPGQCPQRCPRAGRRRSRRAQGPRPVAAADLCRAGEGRQDRRQLQPVASRPRPGLIAIDAGHGFAFPALELAEAELVRRWRASRASPPRRSGARSHCGAAGHPVERLARQGPRRADVRQHAGRDRAVGRREAGVRHQSDRIRLPAAGPAADRGRPVAVQGGARQRPGGQTARRAHSRGLGARRERQGHHRSGRGAARHHGADGRRQGHGARR